MAKKLAELLSPSFGFISPNIKQCPCGCGVIDRRNHAYIESKVTGHWYADMGCLVEADGARWVGDRVQDEWGNNYSLNDYKKVMEVVSHG